MKHRPLFAFVVTCVLIALLAGCSDTKKPRETVILGSDTVAIDSLMHLVPGDTAVDTLPFAVVLRELLARRATEVSDSTVEELGSTLSLRTGHEWSPRAARAAYGAARHLRRIISGADRRAMAAYLDSARGRIGGLQAGAPGPLPDSARFADTSETGRMELLTAILESQTGLSATSAALVAEYAMSEPRPSPDSIEVTGVVRGLVRDSTTVKDSVSRRAIAPKGPPQDNSALALKYRGSGSIKDSIGKHTPNLEALYKKVLKRHAGMAGTVYVTFRVAPSGTVLSARIKSTQIEHEEFLNPFIEYAKTMRFKPIPERIGPMTFDFPFEFKPQS
jgi:TonB family protein